MKKRAVGEVKRIGEDAIVDGEQESKGAGMGNGMGRNASSHVAPAAVGASLEAVPGTAGTADTVIVGGGPAGVVLAFLLARQGVNVVLLEAQGDFDRDFRGDTIHPAIMELMDTLGLAGRLLEVEHEKVPQVRYLAPSGGRPFVIADLGRLRTRFPYLVLMLQSRFIGFLLAEAKRYPNLEVRMRSRVQELIEEEGVVRGVRYRSPEGVHEVRARLVVGADGRFSRVRQLAGIELEEFSAGTDVLYFNAPRRPDDAAGAVVDIHFGPTASLALIDRGTYWQAGVSIPKGTYQKARAAGVGPIKKFVGEAVPWLSDRLEGALTDWGQLTLLSVKIGRAERWHRPGLLLIGDAAHVMSPSGGVGINLAAQDAVAAANALTEPLRSDAEVREEDLARVQRRRGWQAALVQGQQVAAEKDIASSFEAGRPYEAPLALRVLTRLPVLGALPAWVTAYGVLPERLKPGLVEPRPRKHSPKATPTVAGSREKGGAGTNAAREEPHQADFASLRGHRYVNLTTFRKNGRSVRTPVWFAEDGEGRLYVYTLGDSGKAKRIRNGGRVLVGPSDVRGKPLDPEVSGTARLLSPVESALAAALLRRKYGLQKRAFDLLHKAQGKTGVYLTVLKPIGEEGARTLAQKAASDPDGGVTPGLPVPRL